MGYKLTKIILILFVALAVATIVPRYFKMLLTSSSDYNKVDYSELLNDFIITDYRIENIDGKKVPILRNRDRKGNEYSSTETDSLMPSSRVDQLLYLGKFPDSINGVSVTAKIISEANYTLYNIDFKLHDYGLYDLRDKESSVSKEWETIDLLRFRGNYAEFVISQSNTIDHRKGEQLTEILNKHNFVWPCQQVFQPNAQNIIESVGYFITDQENNLFRLSMDKNNLIVEKIDYRKDETIQTIYFTDRADFLALIATEEGHLYKMQSDFTYVKLPLPSVINKHITMRANFFYRMFILSNSEHTEYYVLDNTYQLIDQYKHENVSQGGHNNKWITEYIFPFEVWQTPWNGFYLQWNAIYHFIWLNFLLSFAILFLYKKQKRDLLSIKSITNILIILITGIFGFVGVLLLSEKEKTI